LSSSPIAPALEQLQDLPAGDRMLLAGECPSLRECLARMPDPRDPRGLRHTLTSLLLAAVAAVLAGARSFTAVGEWVADAPPQVLASLGVRRDPLTGRFQPPDEATIRRVLETIDADAFDAAVGSWLAGRLRAGHQRPGHRRRPRRALAVDGKAVRGTRHASGDGQAVHLLAAADQQAGAVLAQTRVDGKTNEVTRFAPLLEPLDLAGWVITADALHTQRDHAQFLVKTKGAHYILIVEHGAHCSRLSAGCVKQSRLAVFYLDTQALPAALGDLDGVELAALDLVQHGLAGDPEDLGGCGEGDPAGRGLGCDAVAELLVDADAPRRAGGELFSDEEAFP
jgi:hypothetical protein